jgi:hypothetical protein
MHPRVLACLTLLALAACATTRAHVSTPFHVVQSFAEPGDELVLDTVESDSATLAPGATVRVRGRYRLASLDAGTLYFGVTNGQCFGDTSRPVWRGSGEFDFTLHVVEPGDLHVSLYSPVPRTRADSCIAKSRFELGAR